MIRKSFGFGLFLSCVFVSWCLGGEPQGTVTGRVVFPDGTPLAGARVRIGSASGSVKVETTTDERGLFAARGLAPGTYQVAVEQDGVAAVERAAEVRAGGEVRLELVAALAARRESITVTATLDARQAASVPSSVVVFDAQRLRSSPGVTLDEVLGAVPGFSLFRRTSSLAAHPTSQGVSLRGIGPSGASRSLVLADGFPLNDPFGGWVYWDMIPREALASVEILRGAASSLYGNGALGGVASILSERPEQNTVHASLAGGSTGIVDGSWFVSTRRDDARGNPRWGLSLDGEAFRNDGYFPVSRHDRGAADAPLALHYVTARARVERVFSGGSTLFASGGILSEDRRNGTELLVNSTDLRYVSLGAERRNQGSNSWRIGVLAEGETFRSTFSSLSADRNRETLTLSQRVPTNFATARGEWSHRQGSRNQITVAGDVRWVEGASHEQSRTGLAVFGGHQWAGGVSVQDVFSPGVRWQVVASLRGDRWSSTDRQTGPGPGQPGQAPRAGAGLTSSATVFNPQLGLRYQASRHVALRAQGYRGFRAPTLNELYRRFQQGNTLTLANPALRPERANGVEAGLDWQAGTSLLRLTGFWTELQNPVSNVTLSSGVTILRQRQNVGRAGVRGLEADWEWWPAFGGFNRGPRRKLGFRASYLFDDAHVQKFAPDPTLQGRWVPQVPRNQGYVALEAGTPRGGFLHLETRLSSMQFDDDRNLLPLAGFAVAGASFTQPMGPHLQWFVHVENLLDRRYPVARTPLIMLSAPRIAQVGVRYRWNGHQ